MSAVSAVEFVRHLAERVASGEPFAVATVVEVVGSASARPGAKSIIDARGRTVFGWVGGGCAESAVRDEAMLALEQGRPRVVDIDLDDEVLGVGMPCGGHMKVYVEPMIKEPSLLILGHGQIAETLARMAKLLEFHVSVNDALATEDAFPTADQRVVDDPDYAKAECDGSSYVVITTQHKSDYEALARVLPQKPAYVGLVASKKRSALILERLLEDGYDREEVSKVSAPCGLDVGAQTPQEIALSILSEVLQVRRGGDSSGRPLRQVKGVVVTADGVEVPSSGKCPS